MKKFSLKALGAAILSLGLVVAGAALPASAVAGLTLGFPAPSFYENSGTPIFSVTADKGSSLVTGGGPLQLEVPTWTLLAGCGATPALTQRLTSSVVWLSPSPVEYSC
ncbi:hypothetical protein [Aurantimicrobium minutum]|uniref:hypothetical protein n=1 Tax=Aurantimicrobium minutum TaxID=708131 RepID=UPI00248D8EC0|nr:hypothetical protein [Aurantimicrobium minutum]